MPHAACRMPHAVDKICNLPVAQAYHTRHVRAEQHLVGRVHEAQQRIAGAFHHFGIVMAEPLRNFAVDEHDSAFRPASCGCADRFQARSSAQGGLSALLRAARSSRDHCAAVVRQPEGTSAQFELGHDLATELAQDVALVGVQTSGHAVDHVQCAQRVAVGLGTQVGFANAGLYETRQMKSHRGAGRNQFSGVVAR